MAQCRLCGRIFAHASFNDKPCGECRSKLAQLPKDQQTAILECATGTLCTGCAELFPYLPAPNPGERPRCDGCQTADAEGSAQHSQRPPAHALERRDRDLGPLPPPFQTSPPPFQLPPPPPRPPYTQQYTGQVLNGIGNLLQQPLNPRNPYGLTHTVSTHHSAHRGFSAEQLAKSQEVIANGQSHAYATPLETNMSRVSAPSHMPAPRLIPKIFKQLKSGPKTLLAAVRPQSTPDSVMIAIKNVVFENIAPLSFQANLCQAKSWPTHQSWQSVKEWILLEGVKYTLKRARYQIQPDDVENDIAILFHRKLLAPIDSEIVPHPEHAFVTLGQFFMHHAYGPGDTLKHHHQFLSAICTKENRLELHLVITMNAEAISEAQERHQTQATANPPSPIKSSSRKRALQRDEDNTMDFNGPLMYAQPPAHAMHTRRRSPYEAISVTAWRINIVEVKQPSSTDDDDDNSAYHSIRLMQVGDAPFDVRLNRTAVAKGDYKELFEMSNDSTRTVLAARCYHRLTKNSRPIDSPLNLDALTTELVHREMMLMLTIKFYEELRAKGVAVHVFNFAPGQIYKEVGPTHGGRAWIVDTPSASTIGASFNAACTVYEDTLAYRTLAALAHYSFQVCNGTFVFALFQGVQVGSTMLIYDVKGHSLEGSCSFEDEGKDGITAFTDLHTCNTLCDALGLERLMVHTY